MEDRLIEITVENDNSQHTFLEGCTLHSVLKGINIPDKDRYIAAYIDNKESILTSRLLSSCHVRFIDRNSVQGKRIVIRSAQFILEKAIFDITGARDFRLACTIGDGIYMNMLKGFDNTLIEKIQHRLNEIIESNIPFRQKDMEYEKALEFFENNGFQDKTNLLKTRPMFYIKFNELDGFLGELMGVTVPSTGYIENFEAIAVGEFGILLHPKVPYIQQLADFILTKKFYHVLNENLLWSTCLNISNIGDINRLIMEGKGKSLIMVGEAYQEKKISSAAGRIHDKGCKIVLISGPSSSGKTTFSMRLSVQLAIHGYRPIPISMDDYFLERDKTPRDSEGNYDFECPEAVDLQLFNSNIKKLLDGECVDMPRYDFITGKRVYDRGSFKLEDDCILVIEGIHALNPTVLPDVDKNSVYRIYASAMIPVSIDFENLIHINDNRLIRRIVRDSMYRGRSAYDTLCCWNKVREGEEKYIFPYQENSDEIINTALFYELAVLGPIAEQLLRLVPKTKPEYAEARRLMKVLTYFMEIPSATIPPTSILREFIGGSAFDY